MKHLLLSIFLLSLSFAGQAQAPSISYSTPQTYTAGTAITSLAPINSGGAVPATLLGMVSTLAGNISLGSSNGTGTAASFFWPTGVAVDASGNIYVADRQNCMIRKITPGGAVTTLAGSTTPGSSDGTGNAASFNYPTGVAVDASGNVYVADYLNHMIRKITPQGVVTTLAGSTTPGSANGTGTAASFNYPHGVAVDALGNVYVAEYLNHMIRKITPGGVVTTLAGTDISGSTNGTVTEASFSGPLGVSADASGNIYVADMINNMIRKITPEGLVTTLAGSITEGSSDGTGSGASFNMPYGVTVDAMGYIYVADRQNHMIRKITPEGVVTTLAGSTTQGSSNGVGPTASFSFPLGVAVDATGKVYVADAGNNMIRKITQYGYFIKPSLPAGLHFDTNTGIINGTPTAISPSTTYTITGTNSQGSSTTTLSIKVEATSIISAPSPTSLSGFSSTAGTASPSQTFTVEGSQLTANLIVTAPTGFEVRESNTGTFSSSVSFTPSLGIVSTKTIEVRIAASASAGTVAGNVVCSSSGSVSQKVTVSGKVAAIILTVSNPTVTLSKSFDGNTSAVVTAGTLSGVLTSDLGNVSLTANATYNNANAGTNKTIIVTYAITGKAAAKYEAPANYAVYTGVIVKKELTVTANNATKTYGDENTAFTVTYNGFAVYENEASLTTLPTATTTATKFSDAASYNIVPAGGVATNYTFNYVNGTLTVNKAQLNITANNATRQKGEANPAFTLSYAGFKGTDGASVIDVLPTASCTADASSVPADYDIILAGGSDNNYTLILHNGKLTVTPPTEVSVAQEFEIRIYPNPAKDYFYIENLPVKTTIRIYNAQGVLVKNSTSTNATEQIGINGLPAGVYMLHLSGKKIETTVHVVIQ